MRKILILIVSLAVHNIVIANKNFGFAFQNVKTDKSLMPLKVSEDGHFVVKEDGTPFFWLADDAWALHNRLSMYEVKQYLEVRKNQGFTVIHTWMVSPWMQENLDGEGPFKESINNKSSVKINQPYFDNIGARIDVAAQKGLYVVLEIGQAQRKSPKHLSLGNPGNDKGAYEYGWKIANALKKDGKQRTNIIWGLGQDTSPGGFKSELTPQRNVEIIRIIAEGVADANNDLPLDSFDEKADYSSTLMSYHPQSGGGQSSKWFHNDDWLDYNSLQSGRDDKFNPLYHQLIHNNYYEIPVKPVIEAEAGYEAAKGNLKSGVFTPYNVRIQAYWGLFSGAFGFQYGHTSTWQFYDPKKFKSRGGAELYWKEALISPGALQMKHVRNLMESRPMLVRKPDQSILLSKVEADGRNTRLQATRADDGSYAFIYSTNGRSFKISMDKISGARVNAWWYNPRNGKSSYIGDFSNIGEKLFDPPGEPGENNDWILVIDNADKNFGAPGKSNDEKLLDRKYGQTRTSPEQPGYIMAHRGGGGEVPENTLLAFRRALRLGATIETDVYLSKDNHIIAMHDKTVDRTTNGSGEVEKMMLSEIKKLDAGKGEKVPTVHEIFSLFNKEAPEGTYIVLDIHGEHKIMYDSLIAALNKYQLFDRTFIEVTDPQVAFEMHNRPNGGEKVRFAMWVNKHISRFEMALTSDLIERIHAKPEMIILVDEMHKLKPYKKLILGGLNKIDIENNTDNWKYVKDALDKIDGINTDYPKYMRDYIKEQNVRKISSEKTGNSWIDRNHNNRMDILLIMVMLLGASVFPGGISMVNSLCGLQMRKYKTI